MKRRFLIAGAGGLGSYLGSVLLDAGQSVRFLCRGDQFGALRNRELVVRRDGRDRRYSVEAIDSADAEVMAGLNDTDWVLFACKTQDSRELALRLRGRLPDQCVVASLQNGVDNEAILQSVFRKTVIGGLCIRFAAHLEKPGVVCVAGPPVVQVGVYPTGTSADSLELVELLRRGGMSASSSVDIRRDLWRKLILNGACNPVSALLSRDIGFLSDSRECRPVLVALMREAAVAARADGVDLAEEDLQQMLGVLDRIDPIKSSMQIDAERGRALEYAGLTEAVIRRCRQLGEAAPVTETVDRLLKALYPPDRPDDL